jgi:hypothetical protein
LKLLSTLLHTSNPEHTIVRGQDAAGKRKRGEDKERKNMRRKKMRSKSRCSRTRMKGRIVEEKK